MTTYNTGNALGSTDPKDLYDNAENFDDAMNDVDSASWTDRFGRARKTYGEIERLADPGTALAAAERAEEARDQAVDAADAAESGSNVIWVPELSDAPAGPHDDGQPMRVTNDPNDTPENPINGLYNWSVGANDFIRAAESAQPASAQAVAVAQATATETRTDVAMLSLSRYTGSGDLYPIIVDDARQMLMYWNRALGVGYSQFYGLVNPSDGNLKISQRDGYGRDLKYTQYVGSGPIVPWYVDAANQVLLGFDTSTNQVVGAFSGGSGAPARTRVRVSLQDGVLRWWTKGSNPTSNVWLEHEIVYAKKDTGDADTQYEVWHAGAVYEVTRAGNTFTRSRMIVRPGEWECAIYERLPPEYTIAPDAVGGSIHGQEFLDWAYLVVDGQRRELTDYGEFDCDKFSFACQSRLYRYDSGNTGDPLALKNTMWTATQDKRVLDNTITFQIPCRTNRTFMSMLSIVRFNPDNGTELVTDTGAREPGWALEDISETDHDVIATPTDEIRVWGPTGISASMVIERGWTFPDRNGYIAGSPQYNKLYWNFTGDAVDIEAGESISARAIYRIDSSN